MARAVIDPAKVKAFASELTSFTNELQSRMQSLCGSYKSLGDTWQDQEHAKFSEEFERSMKNLRRFIEAANNQTPVLTRKADKIEEYLNQR